MDPDILLRRVERTALTICLVMAAMAFVLAGGRPGPATGVLAGGFLVSFSYWTLKRGVSSLAHSPSHASGTADGDAMRRPNPLWTFAKVVVRYALLALLAYVMIARLRLHPLGLLAGASSVVAAVSIEAVRFLMKKS